MRGRGPATFSAVLFLGCLATNLSTWPAAIGLALCLPWVRRPSRVALLAIAPLAYCAASFVISGGTPSYDFFRRDGLIFASLMPLLVRADRDRMEKALPGYLGVQAAVAVLGIAGWIVGGASWSPYQTREALPGPAFYALYVAHNACGSVFGLLAIAAVLLWMRERGRMAWLLVALGALLLAGLVLSRSRGPLGGAILVIAAALVARRTLVARPWVPLAVGAVVAVAFSGVLVSRLLELRDPGGTHAGRAEYWPKAWEDFRSAPVFGIGFGRYNDERTADGWIVRNDDKTAHNSYLHWMAEGGVVGLAVMAAFWALVFRETWRLPDGFWRDAGLSGIVFLALISVTEHYLGGGIALLHLSLFLGVAHAGAKSEEEGSPLAPGGACPPERPPGGPA